MRTLVVTMLMALALGGLHPPRGRAQAPAGDVILPRGSLQPSRPVRRLSVDEAVTLALEQNLDLRVERINPLIQDTLVAEARSVYAPTLSTTVIGDDRDSPAANIFAGAGGEVKVTDRFLQDSVDVVQQVPWMGGLYSARWNGTRTSTTNIFSTFNPVLRSNLSLSYTQPLARNFRIDAFRHQIEVSSANRDLSEIDLRRIVVSTARNVRNAYWQPQRSPHFIT